VRLEFNKTTKNPHLSDWCYNSVIVDEDVWGSPNAMPVWAYNYKGDLMGFKYNNMSYSTDENPLVEVRAEDSEVMVRIYDHGEL